MQYISKIAGMLTILMSVTSYADTSVDNAVISKLIVGPWLGDVVRFSVEPAPQSPGDCTGPYHYKFDASSVAGKNTLSVVLAAYASKRTIDVKGWGDCLADGIDDLKYVIPH